MLRPMGMKLRLMVLASAMLAVSACTGEEKAAPMAPSSTATMTLAPASPQARPSANADLEAACRDNRARAFTAADRSKGAGVSRAEARRQVAAFVKEVRDVPSCFAASVRNEAELAHAALGRGEVPKLRGTVGIL